MNTHTTKSEVETKGLAAVFAKELKGGEVVELVGDLGSGKTTFVRGVVEALGSSARVKSPTFTILNEYPIDQGMIKTIAHLDLYRFESADQLEGIGLDDYRKSDTVIFIEWPENVPDDKLKAT
ncbi:MAG: tRNA (adenosine(37)-N6)-threonylcarbamoyltransferase complex ATPase subunit type 1 TsaE, partial [Patescibacteria group bacterium]